MADERERGGPLDPLPDWQLFASVATQSELLDDVAQRVGAGSVAEVGFDPAAVASESVPDPTRDSLPVAMAEAGQPTALDVSSIDAKVVTTPAALTTATPQTMTVQLADLSRPVRRSVFLRPLPTLADVAPGVEPAVREIAPVGSDYRAGSIGRAIHG